MNITLVVPGKSIPTVEAVNNYLLGRAFEQVGGAIKEENMPALVEAFVGRPGTFDVSANVTKTAAESMLRQKLEAIHALASVTYVAPSVAERPVAVERIRALRDMGLITKDQYSLLIQSSDRKAYARVSIKAGRK